MKNKLNLFKIFKIAFGSCLSIILATILNLSNGVSAGVITLLSIQNTKKETLFITMKRFVSFFLALFIAYFCFSLFGYRPLTVGLFLFLFVTVLSLLSLEEGISMNTVLVTHFFVAESMSPYWIKNEFLLLIIGTGIGVLVNLYIPSNQKIIQTDQKKVEEMMQDILLKMSQLLLIESKSVSEPISFLELDQKLKEALERAYDNMNNTLLSDTRYYIQYLDMRRNQSLILQKIYIDICRLDRVPQQTYIISDFFHHISEGFHEYNNVIALQKELNKIRTLMKKETLPVTRKEFENRAILYRILFEAEEFLMLKSKFVESLSEKQIKRFWNPLFPSSPAK